MGQVKRTEIIKFDNFECEVVIYDDSASLTYYTIKRSNHRIFKGKKFHSFIGGAHYSKYANTYEMVMYYLHRDDSTTKYFI